MNFSTRLGIVLIALSLLGAEARSDVSTPCGEVIDAKIDALRAELVDLQREFDANTRLRNEHYHWLAMLDPYLVLHRKKLYRIRDEASLHELALFDQNLSDSESDAFRHFYGTLRLARDFPLKYAKLVPEIHDSGFFDLGSLMDKYNNRVAFDFARAHLPEIRRKWDEDKFAAQALAWAQESPLISISPTDLCTCERFPAFFAWADRYIRATRAYLSK
jgi:hypothetical protein